MEKVAIGAQFNHFALSMKLVRCFKPRKVSQWKLWCTNDSQNRR